MLRPMEETALVIGVPEAEELVSRWHERLDPIAGRGLPGHITGDARIENAQTTCPHCNASKRDRGVPVNPPPDYRGPWPRSWWPGQW